MVRNGATNRPSEKGLYAISELPFASDSKRVFVRNHSNKKRFDLHENGREGGRHFHMNGFTRRFVFKRRQKVTRPFCSAPGIEISFRLQHRKSAIHGLIVKSDKSQKLGTVRVLDPRWRPEGSRALGTRIINSNTVALLTQRKRERLGANLTLLGTKTRESLDTKS